MSYFANGHFAKSVDAGFIKVSGVESIDFLQSILTANVATIAIGDCRPAALLTPQGRVLIDMMVYRPSDQDIYCLLYTSPSPRDAHESRMPSSA